MGQDVARWFFHSALVPPARGPCISPDELMDPGGGHLATVPCPAWSASHQQLPGAVVSCFQGFICFFDKYAFNAQPNWR